MGAWAGGIPKVDAFKANSPNDLLRNDALIRVGIDIGLEIQEFNDIDSRTTSGRYIGDKREGVSSLDGTEGSDLVMCDSVRD